MIIGENQSKYKNNLGYYIKLDRITELARAFDLIMARNFDDRSKQVVFRFLRRRIF